MKPPRAHRPFDEIIRDLVQALARQIAEDHHYEDLKSRSSAAPKKMPPEK